MTTLTRPPAESSDRRKPAGEIKKGQFKGWLLDGMPETSGKRQGPHGNPDHDHTPQAWWQVMCLTGVDYFSTLGYQPGIAALAAGLLSPLATLVLVAAHLARGAAGLPPGRGRKPPRRGLDRHAGAPAAPWWRGSSSCWCCSGFAATDFMITITLSAADATAHCIENPFAPAALHGQQSVSRCSRSAYSAPCS